MLDKIVKGKLKRFEGFARIKLRALFLIATEITSAHITAIKNCPVPVCIVGQEHDEIL